MTALAKFRPFFENLTDCLAPGRNADVKLRWSDRLVFQAKQSLSKDSFCTMGRPDDYLMVRHLLSVSTGPSYIAKS